MATRLVQISMKARDDSALSGFWAEAFGWGVSSEGPGVTNLEPEGFVYPDPVAVCLDLIASPEPKTVKNRVHVDLATTSAAHRGGGHAPEGSRRNTRRFVGEWQPTAVMRRRGSDVDRPLKRILAN
jgi:hypothetical protein